ncbi:MAG: chorismate mutase [Bacteroidales bacterium]
MKEQFKKIEEWSLYKERPLIISGPCSAESREQVLQGARELAATGRVDIFRAGVWKPRTRPNSFEGVGKEGLKWLREVKESVGLPVATEVANASHTNDALKFGVDLLWIGARTSANPFAMQEIADALNGVDVPVLVKNPINPDLNLWVGAIERIVASGITQIGAIHRGFSTIEQGQFRNQPLWLLPIELKRMMPTLPLLCDPSHIGGAREHLHHLSQKALDLNYDGLMIESHIDPDSALSDNSQQVNSEGLVKLLSSLILRDQIPGTSTNFDTLSELRAKIDLYDEQLLELLGQRMQIAQEIGEYKKGNNIAIFQSSRWEVIMEQVLQQGAQKGLSAEFIGSLFRAIHQESINHQNKVMNL